MLFFVLAYQNHIYNQTARSLDVIDAEFVKLETPWDSFVEKPLQNQTSLTVGKVCLLKPARISTKNLSVLKKSIIYAIVEGILEFLKFDKIMQLLN